MKIKKDKQLTVGSIFDWETTIPACGGIGTVIKKQSVIVQEVYDHFVLVRTVEPPYLKYTIQNVDLMLQGKVKRSDCVMKFKSKEGRLKFFDKGV